MCCPLFSPQMTGGAGPSGGITVNSRILIRIKKRGLSPYQGVAQTLAHDGVRVLHHGVHGVGVVVLLRPRQRQALEVQPQLAHGGAGRAHPESAGLRGRVRGGRVQRQVAPVLARLLAAARGEDAARAEAVRAAAAGPASVRGALRGGVAGAVGAEAGAARRVGELDHGEQAEHSGPQHGAGARA